MTTRTHDSGRWCSCRRPVEPVQVRRERTRVEDFLEVTQPHVTRPFEIVDRQWFASIAAFSDSVPRRTVHCGCASGNRVTSLSQLTR